MPPYTHWGPCNNRSITPSSTVGWSSIVTLLKSSSKVTRNCGLTCFVSGLYTKATLLTCIEEWPRYTPCYALLFHLFRLHGLSCKVLCKIYTGEPKTWYSCSFLVGGSLVNNSQGDCNCPWHAVTLYRLIA